MKKELKPQTSINNFTRVMWQNQLPLCNVSLHTEPCLLYWHIACNGVMYNGAAVPRVLVRGITDRCETVNTWKLRSQPTAFLKRRCVRRGDTFPSSLPLSNISSQPTEPMYNHIDVALRVPGRKQPPAALQSTGCVKINVCSMNINLW